MHIFSHTWLKYYLFIILSYMIKEFSADLRNWIKHTVLGMNQWHLAKRTLNVLTIIDVFTSRQFSVNINLGRSFSQKLYCWLIFKWKNKEKEPLHLILLNAKFKATSMVWEIERKLRRDNHQSILEAKQHSIYTLQI